MGEVQKVLEEQRQQQFDFSMKICRYIRYGLFDFKKELVSKDQSTILSWDSHIDRFDVKFALTVNGLQLAAWSKDGSFFNWPTPEAQAAYNLAKISGLLDDFFIDYLDSDKTGGVWDNQVTREGIKGFRREFNQPPQVEMYGKHCPVDTSDGMYDLANWLRAIGVYSNFIEKDQWEVGFFLININRDHTAFDVHMRSTGERLFHYHVSDGHTTHVCVQYSNKVNTKIMGCVMQQFYHTVRNWWKDSGKLVKEPPVTYMEETTRYITPAWIMWSDLTDVKGPPSTLDGVVRAGMHKALSDLCKRRPVPDGTGYQIRPLNMQTGKFEIVEIKETVICN